MTTEHPEPGSRAVPGGDLFPTVMHGYDKRRVEDHIAELQGRVSALEAELEDARRGLLTADEDRVAIQARGDPGRERVSQRMMQILRLADEEAQQERDEAAQHAAAVLERAQAEASGLLAAAESTAEEVLRAAMRRSDEELAATRAEASRVLASAREQAVAAGADREAPGSVETERRGEQPVVGGSGVP